MMIVVMKVMISMMLKKASPSIADESQTPHQIHLFAISGTSETSGLGRQEKLAYLGRATRSSRESISLK